MRFHAKKRKRIYLQKEYDTMKRPLLIIALAVLFSLRATAQQTDYTATDSVLAYIKHAMLFNRSMPQEKAYLHLDNTGYFKGERIWFKAYLRRADTGEPSDISKVLYVELLNPSGDVIQKAKLKVENGEAAGDLGLDSIFGSGFYEIRAYTRYMMNFGDATAFSRVLPVFNKPKTEGDYSNLQTGDLLFFGNRDTGRVSHVALYIGEGKIIHASQVVRINTLSGTGPDVYENAWRLLYGRRILGTSDALPLTGSPYYFVQK